MYVLMDIEWVENSFCVGYPTQLAAIRADGAWQSRDVFSALIKPLDDSFCKWEHIAFSGCSADDFLRAESAEAVFESFFGWLKPDDVLCWWAEQNRMVFNEFCCELLSRQPENHSVVLSDYVFDFLSEAAVSRGSPYKLAQAHHIAVPEIAHNSANDVLAMLCLLSGVMLPQILLLYPCKKGRETKDTSAVSLINPELICDTDTMTVHKSSCARLRPDMHLKAYSTWKGILKNGCRPCHECCRQEYAQALRKRNADTVERSEYNYVYSPNSAVFHRRNCSRILSAYTILGSIGFSTACETGRTPCKVCNPTVADEKRSPKSKPKKPAQNAENRHVVSNNAYRRALERFYSAQVTRSKDNYKKLGSETEKKDFIVRTRTDLGFWAARGYAAFHRENCPKLEGKSNLVGFSQYDAAVGAGFTPCKLCKPTRKDDIIFSIPAFSHTRKWESAKDLEALCRESGYRFSVDKKYFNLETPVGKWRITITQHPVSLLHINLAYNNYRIDKNSFNQYHVQPKIFLSMIDAFIYIKRHDEALMNSICEERIAVR